MVKPIVKGEEHFGTKAEPASNRDIGVIRDLMDTLRANSARCVGMAANMIGVNKRIIVFSGEDGDQVMVNPRIVAKSGPYEAEEGCLSLEGTRKAIRYREITVEYLDGSFRKRRGRFSGFTAQIIQHETDHLEGITI